MNGPLKETRDFFFFIILNIPSYNLLSAID